MRNSRHRNLSVHCISYGANDLSCLRAIADTDHLAPPCPDLQGKLIAIVTKPGKMGYGSYTQLVIYGQQLPEPSTWCHKRNGGS